MRNVRGILVRLHGCPSFDAEVRMRLQHLGCFRARLLHSSQMAVARRQKSSAFGRILHAVNRVNGFLVALQIEVRAAKMPEILVGIKRIEPHGILQECNRLFRTMAMGEGVCHIGHEIGIVRIKA